MWNSAYDFHRVNAEILQLTKDTEPNDKWTAQRYNDKTGSTQQWDYAHLQPAASEVHMQKSLKHVHWGKTQQIIQHGMENEVIQLYVSFAGRCFTVLQYLSLFRYLEDST